jgi:phage major head subunit gpT-like protein
MPSIATSSALSDLLDPRFFQVSFQAYDELDDVRSQIYNMKTPTQKTERWSEISPMGDMQLFEGYLTYDSVSEGYQGTATALQFALATQIERELWEFDQFDIVDKLATELGRAARKRQQKDAVRIFENAFDIDTFFGTNSEGVALCSASHTTTRTGVSTSTGFDNTSTSGLSPVALSASITQFRRFRDLAGEPIDEEPDTIVYPIDLEDRVSEILGTPAGLDSAESNINVHQGRLRKLPLVRLTDTDNFFLINSRRMKENLFWFEKVGPEFSQMESFEHIVAKYRVYSMYTIGRDNWRWILGHNVS